MEDSSEDSLDAEAPKGWSKDSKRQRLDETDALESDDDDEQDDDDDEDLESMAQQLEKEVMDN